MIEEWEWKKKQENCKRLISEMIMGSLRLQRIEGKIGSCSHHLLAFLTAAKQFQQVENRLIPYLNFIGIHQKALTGRTRTTFDSVRAQPEESEWLEAGDRWHLEIHPTPCESRKRSLSGSHVCPGAYDENYFLALVRCGWILAKSRDDYGILIRSPRLRDQEEHLDWRRRSGNSFPNASVTTRFPS